MKLRNYISEDSQIICSWVKDEKTLFQWSADRIGKYPLLGNELNGNYEERNVGKDFLQITQRHSIVMNHWASHLLEKES